MPNDVALCRVETRRYARVRNKEVPMNQQKYAISAIVALILALVLEILPYGAVLNFAVDGGETLRATFSYFDPITFGYANFAPLITAGLTCLLLVMTVATLFWRGKALLPVTRTLSLCAFVISLAPLLVNCYSVIGGIISAFLLTTYILTLKRKDLS